MAYLILKFYLFKNSSNAYEHISETGFKGFKPFAKPLVRKGRALVEFEHAYLKVAENVLYLF